MVGLKWCFRGYNWLEVQTVLGQTRQVQTAQRPLIVRKRRGSTSRKSTFQLSASTPDSSLQPQALRRLRWLITTKLCTTACKRQYWTTSTKLWWEGFDWQVYLWGPSLNFKWSYLSHLKSYRVRIQNSSLLPSNLLLGLILSKGFISAVWRATGLIFRISFNYPQIFLEQCWLS